MWRSTELKARRFRRVRLLLYPVQLPGTECSHSSRRVRSPAVRSCYIDILVYGSSGQKNHLLAAYGVVVRFIFGLNSEDQWLLFISYNKFLNAPAQHPEAVHLRMWPQDRDPSGGESCVCEERLVQSREIALPHRDSDSPDQRAPEGRRQSRPHVHTHWAIARDAS